MFFIKKKKGWEMPESESTPEKIYMDRRRLIKAIGIGAALLLAGCDSSSYYGLWGGGEEKEKGRIEVPKTPTSPLYPAKRNSAFTLERPLTPETTAAMYNNFYEFSWTKSVWKRVEKFQIRPWQIEVGGLVEKPLTFDIDGLVKMMPLEERLYRFRCVEAWAMAVPWTGFLMREFVKKVKPLSSARFVKMTGFLRPEEAPYQSSRPDLPWPYWEGLTMEEATNELTLLVTGVYGHELPKQHGSPLRLIVPWKYGFKSIKSIVRFEFTEESPGNFWNTMVPYEYDFRANVNPQAPHPRWSQETERMIGTNERRPTLKYNGYAEFVSQLYGG